MNYLEKYLGVSPVALAIIRANECYQLSQIQLRTPVLDLGCGDGVFASICFSAPVDVGIDISTTEILSACRVGVYKHLSVADAHHMPFPANFFETVFSNSVLEHIPNLQPVLNEVSRVLRPDGVLMFTVPTTDFQDLLFCSALLRQAGLRSLSMLYGRAVNGVFKHHNLLDYSTWEKNLCASGLQITDHLVFNPPSVMKLHDLFLLPSVMAYVTNKFLSRWILWPGLRRKLIAPLLAMILGSYVGKRAESGGSLLLVARKT